MFDRSHAWSKARLDAHRFRSLLRLVRFAWERSSFYRDHWSANGFEPTQLQSLDDLQRIPITERLQLKDAFAEGAERVVTRPLSNRLHSQTTSGSSGIPIPIRWTRKEWRETLWNVLRAYRLQGLRWRDTTQCLADPVDIKKPAIYQRLGLLRYRYHDIYQDIDGIREVISALDRVDVLKGMPSDLYTLAYHVHRRSDPFPTVGMVQSNSEVLDEPTRRFVSQVFDAPVLDLYSAVDGGVIAFQTEADGPYHVSEPNVILEAGENPELHDGDHDAIVTNLTNLTTPIIRYRFGDVIRTSPGLGEPHGELPWRTIEGIHGKYLDFLLMPDDSIVSAHVVKQNLTHLDGIARFRVVQERRDHLIIDIQPDDDWDDSVEAEVRALMSRDLHDSMEVEIRFDYDLFSKVDYRKFKVIESKVAQEFLSRMQDGS